MPSSAASESPFSAGGRLRALSYEDSRSCSGDMWRRKDGSLISLAGLGTLFLILCFGLCSGCDGRGLKSMCVTDLQHALCVGSTYA